MILQSHIPYDVSPKALPGMAPMAPDDWIWVDDAFGPQMVERARLLTDRRDDVLALDDSARPAADELLETIMEHLDAHPDYTVCGAQVIRPDGVTVAVDRRDPMGTLGILVQQDLCILQKQGDEHVLTGAVLCFPSYWTLSEKIMRPMVRIHLPVDMYDDNIARRVQRLFDGIKPGRPMWRFNAHLYDDPTLFTPRREADRYPRAHNPEGAYLRSERQTLWRLPETGAVIFGIHTFMVRRKTAAT
ncbi:heme-dependent oxidative N-demethylase family protein [Lacimonas salitolerans]|uniref:DUF3445 domain-containing protein n=1 Tax=Lacimonas salitolerans TaxID=1323750 RepID=A0ABW4EGE4_9RHOB